MRRILLQVIGGALGVLALSAHGQAQGPPEVVGSVTILTDGVAEPNGLATLAINAAIRDLKVQIQNSPACCGSCGRAAVANVRDLLHLKGVDLAILNSDVLAFLQQTGKFPKLRAASAT
jgi:hypothetical protein